MTIYRADELKQSLLAAIREAPVLEIDLSAVTEIDTAGVQLLMLARKAAQADGHALRMVAHSAAVVEAFELLNLAACFGDPIVIAAAA
ncbi:MAG TPA: STAS domain-containing protein [Paucimonas sp.]|nr:STAS domain-containing protein [Paucimonas sp.]